MESATYREITSPHPATETPPRPLKVLLFATVVLKNAAVHLADRSSDLKSPTGPRCVSLSGLTIELMLVIRPPAIPSANTPISRCCPSRKSAPGPPLTSTGRNDTPGTRAPRRIQLFSVRATRLRPRSDRASAGALPPLVPSPPELCSHCYTLCVLLLWPAGT
jgi:hypothetical protein